MEAANDAGDSNGIKQPPQSEAEDPGQGAQQAATGAGAQSTYPAAPGSLNGLDVTLCSPSQANLGPPGLRGQGAEIEKLS